MSSSPLLIEDTNLSIAWRRTLDNIIKSKNHEITPLLLSLTGFEESANIREVLESNLKSKKNASINTVAETIFPHSLYQLCGYDRYALYKEYITNLPRIKEIDLQQNGRGTYFERLIAFDGKINQLENIIFSYQKKKGVRRSKLQASIFDARSDHTNGAYQKFPCLQHVTFYATKGGGLVLNSFYAVQYLYERAYGNWLGLINLGKFMANEMHLKFERLNCYVGVEKLDDLKISEAKSLLELTK